MTDFNNEITTAAHEAIFGLQLDRKQAVKFVLNNVGRTNRLTIGQAEDAINDVLIGYKG